MVEQRSKYGEIADWIKLKIDKGELTVGTKIYSENELVSIFGVSRQTVRHAISILSEEGILERRRGSQEAQVRYKADCSDYDIYRRVYFSAYY